MTDYSAVSVPASAREFHRWFVERCADWPAGLMRLGTFADLSLSYLDQPDANRSLSLDKKACKDLQKFAAAYAEWKAESENARYQIF